SPAWECRSCIRSFFFFFQAEDGIRDFHVTGVQTCALPIFIIEWDSFSIGRRARVVFDQAHGRQAVALNRVTGSAVSRIDGMLLRSEERRVGKEGRSRGAGYDC